MMMMVEGVWPSDVGGPSIGPSIGNIGPGIGPSIGNICPVFGASIWNFGHDFGDRFGDFCIL